MKNFARSLFASEIHRLYKKHLPAPCFPSFPSFFPLRCNPMSDRRCWRGDVCRCGVLPQRASSPFPSLRSAWTRRRSVSRADSVEAVFFFFCPLRLSCCAWCSCHPDVLPIGPYLLPLPLSGRLLLRGAQLLCSDDNPKVKSTPTTHNVSCR